MNGWPPSISAVETPATGDITEKEKPWKTYPKLTVYKENAASADIMPVAAELVCPRSNSRCVIL